jgi:hypothetical protein
MLGKAEGYHDSAVEPYHGLVVEASNLRSEPVFRNGRELIPPSAVKRSQMCVI